MSEVFLPHQANWPKRSIKPKGGGVASVPVPFKTLDSKGCAALGISLYKMQEYITGSITYEAVVAGATKEISVLTLKKLRDDLNSLLEENNA